MDWVGCCRVEKGAGGHDHTTSHAYLAWGRKCASITAGTKGQAKKVTQYTIAEVDSEGDEFHLFGRKVPQKDLLQCAFCHSSWEAAVWNRGHAMSQGVPYGASPLFF